MCHGDLIPFKKRTSAPELSNLQKYLQYFHVVTSQTTVVKSGRNRITGMVCAVIGASSEVVAHGLSYLGLLKSASARCRSTVTRSPSMRTTLRLMSSWPVQSY